MKTFIDRIVGTRYAKRFMLEVTEDALVATGLFHYQSRILPLLRKAGIGVSIDDFGAGYSFSLHTG